MMGKTHYSLGVLYYLLFSMIPAITIVNLSDIGSMVICILASAVGALFPDADSDHSLINSRNPAFKKSNSIVNRYRNLAKKTFAFLFFSVPCGLIIIYMYNKQYLSRELVLISVILFILAINGVKVGEKIYVPILTKGLRGINTGAARIKKYFMMTVYLSIGIACIYLSKGNIEGITWGIIFIAIAIFPHRTFLHSPEGLILATIGVKHVENILSIPNISIAFFIGYFSHLYLADIFTNSGVPISVIPLILRWSNLHNKLKKYRFYMGIYKLLNKKLSIPLVKTGSKLGNWIEGIYVLSLFILLFVVIAKYKIL